MRGLRGLGRQCLVVEGLGGVRVEGERELVTARETDPSPHFDGRAQPGDVIGLETGGERTHVGETAEDENKRRIDAERDYRKETRKD